MNHNGDLFDLDDILAPNFTQMSSTPIFNAVGSPSLFFKSPDMNIKQEYNNAIIPILELNNNNNNVIITTTTTTTANTVTSSSPSPISTTSNVNNTQKNKEEELTVDEKTLKRRKREREAARRCRAKKKRRKEELKERLEELKKERQDLEQQHALSRIEQWLAHREDLMKRISEEINNTNEDEELLINLLDDLSQSNRHIHQIIQYNAKLFPLYVEMAHFRNIILWLYLTPIGPMLRRLNETNDDVNIPIAHEEVDERTKPHLDMINRIKEQLQDETKFTPHQLTKIFEFRQQWYKSIQECYDSNLKVVDVMKRLHNNQTDTESIRYTNMVEQLFDSVNNVLTPKQRARAIAWFNSNGITLQKILIEGTFLNS